MWFNKKKISDSAISAYRQSLLRKFPHHIVIDNLFEAGKLNEVIKVLEQPQYWKTQQHTYSELYVNQDQWQKASAKERFVQRDSWHGKSSQYQAVVPNIAYEFLKFLRSDDFMSVLSKIFNVDITDINVDKPEINTNFFRLGSQDFVEQHADDSPGREICLLLYLNKNWQQDSGGELVFIGEHDSHISIAPLFNRCVLFDPASTGSEHWVNKVNPLNSTNNRYRFNVTSWYWSE